MPKGNKKSNRSTFRFPILRREMQLQGYTVKSLAQRIGIAESSLRNKMDGTTKFYLEESRLISRLLNKTVDYIFNEF